MKSLTVVLVLLSVAFCNSIVYHWDCASTDVMIDRYQDWDVVSIDGGVSVFPSGCPDLPAVSRCYLIPQGTTLSSVQVRNVVTSSLGCFYQPVPVLRTPSAEIQNMHFNHVRNAYSGFSGAFPLNPVSGFKTGSKTGFRLGSYSFVPFTYDASNGELLLITSADIEMTFECDPLVSMDALSSNQVDLAKTCLACFIDNPEMLDEWAPLSRPGTDEDVEVIVVGNNSQQTLLEELISLHSQTGYDSQFLSLQWINSNVDGYDVQEKIRNHLKDLYLNNGLCFAVLVGDSGITVRQSMLCGDGRMEPMGSCADLYYSDLDGTWDSDGDHLYGELSDEVDYYSDLYVGRYPTNPGEANQLSEMISHFSDYHFNQSSGDWSTSALLAGSRVCFQGSPWDYGSMYCDSIESLIPSSWNVTSLCTDTTGYHPGNFTGLFNEGASFVAIIARANHLGYYWEDMEWLLNAGEVANGTELPWICSEISSFSGGIDNLFGKECIAEVLLSHENGGAILVSAPSAISYLDFTGPAPGAMLTVNFADLLFSHDIVTAGLTHALAKDAFWASYNSSYPSTVSEWTMQSVNLYGDPCTIFAGAPEGISSTPSSCFEFHVAPNPANEATQFVAPTFSEVGFSLFMFDVAGRMVKSVNYDGSIAVGSSLVLDCSDLPSGLYSVILRSGNETGIADCVVLR